MISIEKQTADTILQRPKMIDVAGKTYNVPVITGATMVLFSEQIAGLKIDSVNTQDFYKELFKHAKQSKEIAKALAILILGADKILREKIIKKWIKKMLGINELNRLTNYIYFNLPIEDMSRLFDKLLSELQPTVFFSLIIFLNEANATKATKTTETIASGQSSEDLLNNIQT